MTKLVYAVHEIHTKVDDKNVVYRDEVFSATADDLKVFEAAGAVRAPTEQELAFHKLTKGDPVKAEVEAKKLADAAAAEKAAADQKAEAAAKKAAAAEKATKTAGDKVADSDEIK